MTIGRHLLVACLTACLAQLAWAHGTGVTGSHVFDWHNAGRVNDVETT